jgi:chromosome segregation ATPase
MQVNYRQLVIPSEEHLLETSNSVFGFLICPSTQVNSLLGRESELRKLRKSTMELEEQNAILSKHIDSLNSAISKFEDDKTQSEQDIKILEPFLESFHEFLSRRLSKSRILDTNTQLKETNIKELLDKLSTSCDETMMLKLKRVLNELDYPQ